MPNQPSLETIVALAKRRGFVYPTSTIYGGLANSYDYGPLGAELLRNIKNAWWETFVSRRSDMVGLNSQILLHPETWVASGHVGSFSDPLVDDEVTKKRYRADHLIEGWIERYLNEIKIFINNQKIINTHEYKNYIEEFYKNNNLCERSYINDLILSFASKYKIDEKTINVYDFESKTEQIVNSIEVIIYTLKKFISDFKRNNNNVFISQLKNLIKRIYADYNIKTYQKIENIENRLLFSLIKFEELSSLTVENLSVEEMGTFITENKILSPDGNPVTQPKAFNLLFETAIGTVADDKATIYMRGETAQGIFTNFRNILDSTRVQLPFGVGQIGKSFRNEITTGQFVFRTLEFEQAEIEYFFNPDKTNWQDLLENWKEDMFSFVTNTLGVKKENIRWRRHSDAERSFYSKDTYDLDYNFSFGWKELWGVAYRTNYDLKQHSKHSGQSLEYRDPHTNDVFVPHVIEPALGINRAFLMVLTDAYEEDSERNRTVLKLAPSLAPYKAAVFPLLKNKPELVEKAKAVYTQLSKKFAVTWDERGNIGKRYLYQDEIGTPVCITIDFDTLQDASVTIRDRNTTQQKRILISELEAYIASMLE